MNGIIMLSWQLCHQIKTNGPYNGVFIKQNVQKNTITDTNKWFFFSLLHDREMKMWLQLFPSI